MFVSKSFVRHPNKFHVERSFVRRVLVIIGFAAWNNGNNLLYLVLSAMIAS